MPFEEATRALSTASASADNAQDQPLLVRADLIEDRALQENGLDLLKHGPLADRVAELVLTADTPLAVALFGPWGSGKSSFRELLRRRLQKTAPKVKLLHYDAWAFAGESLQRNFISHAARELGLDDKGDGHPFHWGSRRAVGRPRSTCPRSTSPSSRCPHLSACSVSSPSVRSWPWCSGSRPASTLCRRSCRRSADLSPAEDYSEPSSASGSRRWRTRGCSSIRDRP